MGNSAAAIGAGTPTAAAADLLSAYRLPTLPVVKGGQVLGVVAAQGLEGAASLEAAVQVVPVFGPEAGVELARAALNQHGAIVVDTEPPGALSPADLAPPVRSDLAGRVWAALRPDDAALLRRLADLAGPDVRVALVGGAVRDALLGEQPADLDLTVVGGDVQALARASGLASTWHGRYGNATLSLPDGRQVDLVSARAEAYPVPGGPPEPRPGTLALDLARRDFGLNALALVVGEPGIQDPLDGLGDLETRTLRPLHAHSFRDDASRLVRAARLAARLDFSAHPELLAQVPDALALADRTPRLWQEIRLALGEPRPGQVFALLDAWGAGALVPDAADRLAPLDALRDTNEVVPELLYAALLVRDDPQLAEALGLGEAPQRLLERAGDRRVYAADSVEVRLRGLLGLPAGPLLRGEDLIALGVPAGPQVGRLLAQVAALTRSGELTTREAALRFVMARLAAEDG